MNFQSVCLKRLKTNSDLCNWWPVLQNEGYCDSTNNWSEIRNRSYKKHLNDAAHSRRTIDKLRETLLWMETHSLDFLVEMKKGMITKF